MEIEMVQKSDVLTQVVATCDGVRLEFTSWRSGPWEVYDHPRAWRGMPRYIGILPFETGIKLDGVLARRARAAA